ncbi:hypothetical protein ACLKA7_001281 [Drosophila subpalustris]
MLPVGKRQTASGSQERADADRSSSTGVVGALRAEGHRLTATVQIGNNSYNATIDTGATSSFVSEELAVTLCEKGFELGATQRQVRLADGRSSGVSEHVEVQIQLGDRQQFSNVPAYKSEQEIAAFATMTGTSPITEHDRPIKQRYFPKNPKMQEEINKQVDELLAKGCIEPSNSPHSAPIVMVKKKTGKWRLCVDFRQLNSRFSKWTELVALRNATAAALQKAFRERILARFGVPKVLITDHRAQFTSRTFKNFLQDMGVKHQYTAPYTPQENPTERANRTVKTMIAQFAGANQRCWDGALPEITLAVNTSVTASTRYSPAFVTQGREPRLPQALFDEVTIGIGQVAQEPRENAEKLKEIFEIVRRSLEKAAQDQARHYNLRRRSWKPSVGEQVWLKEHHLSNAAEGFAAKLAPRFGGPYRVVDFVSPVICKLQSPMDNKTKRAHISDLIPHVTAGENRSE